MILSGHIIQAEDLRFRKDDENILNTLNHFKNMNILDKSDDIDVYYVVVDNKRYIVIRSGAAASDIARRWKKHSTASMLKEHISRSNKFYASYPNMNCPNVDIFQSKVARDNFDDLSMRVGVGMEQDKMLEITVAFHWNDVENPELGSLNGNVNRQSLNHKKYRHLCYIFETVYALAIEPPKHISSNAACEWQLQFYGKSSVIYV